ncbi:Cell division protein FtsI (Peptidoglycan synthetase) [Streptococcus sp. DD13]|nr:Cell division protein FtsI (Peptidoglycan synthetase) [Streptococcus sp. DD13]
MIIGTDHKFGVKLSEAALKVHQSVQVNSARRGTIYDRNGQPIAEDSTTYTIYAIVDKTYARANGEKLHVQESQYNQVADILNKQLGLEKNYVLEQLKQKNAFQVYFGAKGKNISNTTMTAITNAMDQAGIKGIAFNSSPSRLYQNGHFASHLIGLASLRDNEDGSQSLVGNTGLEQAFNGILSGKDGRTVYEKDSAGRLLPGTDIIEEKTVNGQDVYTTLSVDLQMSLESNMDNYISKTQPVNAQATIMSAKTGEILATTQRPTFDASTQEGVNDKDFSWSTLLYQGQYEPGSTMKVMTLAAAIDNGTFNANAVYTNNTYKVIDTEINDWEVNEGKPTRTMTFAQGFAFSSNVGMTMLEQQMGKDKWLNYLNKFKFGYPTRFGMLGESFGSLPEDNEVSIAMSAFGQAISVTPIQMMRSFSAIGNDGVMLEPKIISGIYDSNDRSARVAKPEEIGHPVSKSAAAQTRNYMISVGTDPTYGTLYASSLGGRIISVDGYNIAVKSGTAQIAASAKDGGGYLQGAHDHVYSVVAMIPAEDPKFIMYMTVQQPKSMTGIEWADIFNPMLTQAMQLDSTLNLSNSSVALNDTGKETEYVPGDATKLMDKLGLKNPLPGDVADELRRHLVHPVVVGNGSTIIAASFDADEKVKANQQVLLLTEKPNSENAESLTIPDMYGWTKANATLYGEWMGIEITFKGKGSKVTAQSANTGTLVSQTKKITLTLGD